MFLVHYDEVATKGRNRPAFEQLLQNAIHFAFHGLPNRTVKRLGGRVVVRFHEPLSPDQHAEAGRRLGRVMGIASFSAAAELPIDLAAVEQRMIQDLRDRRFSSFRVTVRRSDKSLPYTSNDAARLLGAAVVREFGTRVDLEHPELTVHVELLRSESLLYYERSAGMGGLPLDRRNKVAVMISGGIDSPVAAFRMMKRGCFPVFVHFHSAPYTGEMSIHKTKEVVRALCADRCVPVLYAVPIAVYQRRMVSACKAPFRVLLYRRLMFRIAEALAAREGALGLVTGESLGQVASQTLANLGAVGDAVRIPILRPLIGMDKQEIIDQARAIGTYDLSIEPHGDCCSYLMPPHPATHCDSGILQEQESKLPIAEWVAEGVATADRWVYGRVRRVAEGESWRRASPPPSSPACQPGEQGDDKQNQEEEEQNFGDSCCRGGDSAEAEERRENRDDQKHERPV